MIIFAEVIPKTYALKNADQIALNVAPLINLTIFILTPATLFTEKLARSVTGPIMNDDEAKTQELKGMIRLHAGKETRAIERGKMMSSMLDMEDVTIEAVMTHRGTVTMIDAKSSASQILKITEKVHLQEYQYIQEPKIILLVYCMRKNYFDIYKEKFSQNSKYKFK